MTEAEAKKKYCPMVDWAKRYPGHSGKCMGSACMMWRWEETTHGGDNIGKDWYKWRYIDNYDPALEGVSKTNQGYCGLAGI